jgi:hypothetical protein
MCAGKMVRENNPIVINVPIFKYNSKDLFPMESNSISELLCLLQNSLNCFSVKCVDLYFVFCTHRSRLGKGNHINQRANSVILHYMIFK